MTEHQHRPRRQFEPRQPLTQEAYQILETAAFVVLQRLGLLDGHYVTKEDLIDNAWAGVYFYVRRCDNLKFLYHDAMLCMFRYVRQKAGPSHFVSLDAEPDETFFRFDRPSGRVLDDPALAAEVLDELENMTDRERTIVLEHLLAGRTLREVGRELGLSDERSRQILWDVRWRGMGG